MKDVFESAVITKRKTIDDCMKKDPITKKIWDWAQKVKYTGRVAFVLILLGGMLFFAYTGPKSLSKYIAFITIYILGLILEYIIYHVAVITLQSLAAITYNTGVTAKLAELNVRGVAAEKVNESIVYEFHEE